MKKGIIIGSIIIISIIIIVMLNFSTEYVQNVDNSIEIEPEEEILDEEKLKSELTLFFNDKTSGILSKEKYIIDSKDLIENPYRKIVELLIKGPTNEEMSNPIPVGTKINDAKFDKGVVTIDLSAEFLDSSGTNSIYSIVNSLFELNEVSGVKFLIDGKEESSLKEIYVKK